MKNFAGTSSGTSIRKFFRGKLPELYFESNYLQRLTQLILLPADIMLQALEGIVDLKNYTKDAPLDSMLIEGSCRNLPKYKAESRENYGKRISKAFETWGISGSRFCIYEVLKDVGLTPDESVYKYGIQEKITDYNSNTAYFGNDNIQFGKFYWGDDVTNNFNFGIHISDPDNIISSNSDYIEMITDIGRRFSEAHNQLVRIYFTNGLGSIISEIKI